MREKNVSILADTLYSLENVFMVSVGVAALIYINSYLMTNGLYKYFVMNGYGHFCD